MRRIHSLKSEPSVVTFEIGIFDQVLDRLNNLHKTPDQIRFDDVIYNDIHEQGHDCSVLYVNDNERTNKQTIPRTFFKRLPCCKRASNMVMILVVLVV